jgi:hypothetical protein
MSAVNDGDLVLRLAAPLQDTINMPVLPQRVTFALTKEAHLHPPPFFLRNNKTAGTTSLRLSPSQAIRLFQEK